MAVGKVKEDRFRSTLSIDLEYWEGVKKAAHFWSGFVVLKFYFTGYYFTVNEPPLLSPIDL